MTEIKRRWSCAFAPDQFVSRVRCLHWPSPSTLDGTPLKPTAGRLPQGDAVDKPPRAWASPGRAPAVVLGRSQRALDLVPVLPVRHRASGGGAVLTGPWLLRAALRLPRTHLLVRDGPLPLARWFGRVHLRWLQTLGLGDARLHSGGSREHWACFGGQGPGEVFVHGRKLAGIAQAWRRSSVLLVSGTQLSAAPWPLLCTSFRRPPDEARELARATIALDECLGCPVDVLACARSLRAALDLACAGSGGSAGPLS